MNRIPVSELSVDTYFDAPVFLDKGYIILSPEIPVSQELESRLNRWGFTEVFSDGASAETPPAETGGKERTAVIIDTSVENEQGRREAGRFYSDMIDTLDRLFDRFKVRNDLRFEEVAEAVKEIMGMMKTHNRFLFTANDTSSPEIKYIVKHSVKTAIYSLAIADFLKLPPHRQLDIGCAALIHAIGLVKIPERIYMSEQPLTIDEKKTLAAHPVLGFKFLKAAGFPPAVCMAVLEQNERLDGSGMPRKLTGDRISGYGKLLAVASSYDAVISNRPYKSGVDGHTGLLDLIKNIGKKYDETFLKALVFTLSLYPLGTYVLLSNGAVGIVEKTNPTDPKYPVIRLLVDERGIPYPEQPVFHTSKDEEIRIERPLTTSELRKLKGKE